MWRRGFGKVDLMGAVRKRTTMSGRILRDMRAGWTHEEKSCACVVSRDENFFRKGLCQVRTIREEAAKAGSRMC